MWGGQGGLNLPLPVPFNPGSRPVFFGSRLFAFFQSQNIAQCCLIFPYFSRSPPHWESRFPPLLLPPPVHLPPLFLLVSRPPVPPPIMWIDISIVYRLTRNGFVMQKLHRYDIPFTVKAQVIKSNQVREGLRCVWTKKVQ